MLGIAGLFNVLGQLESAKIAVKQSRCLSVRNRNVECLRCLDACTTGCISRDEETGGVRVSPEKCIGCGACCTACPTGALAPKDPDDSVLLRELAVKGQACGGHVVVVCSKLLDRVGGLCDLGKLASVPCLGRVDESMVLSLVAMGASAVTLVHAECGECAHSQGMQTALMVRDNANALLDAWGSEVRLKVSVKLPSCVKRSDQVECAECDEGRRTFLKGAVGKSAKAACAAVELSAGPAGSAEGGAAAPSPAVYDCLRAGEGRALPQFVPHRRRRVNAALKALGEPADVMVETRLWGHVVIDVQACTACRMCATFCPTGALRPFDEDGDEGEIGVAHSPSLCVKCRMCEGVCPAHAVSISESVFAVDLLKGEVERYVVPKPATLPDNPHQIHRKLKTLWQCTQVYER